MRVLATAVLGFSRSPAHCESMSRGRGMAGRAFPCSARHTEVAAWDRHPTAVRKTWRAPLDERASCSMKSA
jgi:hypothetical protein